MVWKYLMYALSMPVAPKCQSMDYTTLKLTTNEITNIAVPSRIENIFQEDNYNLIIQVKTNQTQSRNELALQFNWHPQSARFGIRHSSIKRIDTSFCTTLKSVLKGKMITNIKLMDNYERIVIMEISERIIEPIIPSHYLYMEIAGPRSNLILTNAIDNGIIGCAYQVSSATSIRPLQLNGVYQPPPPTTGILDPVTMTYSAFQTQIISGISQANISLEKLLMMIIKGMSPNIAKQILANVGIDTSSSTNKVHTINDIEIDRLFQAIMTWKDVMTTSKADALINPMNQGTGFSIIDLESKSSESIGDGSSVINQNNLVITNFLSKYYSTFDQISQFTLLRNTCERKWGDLSKKGSKLLTEFEKQLQEAQGGKAEDLSNTADLVTAFTYSWDSNSKSNTKAMKCIDFITGDPVNIDIPPGVTPTQYADKLYKQARKLRRSIKALLPLIQETKRQLQYLDEIKVSIDSFQNLLNNDDISILYEISEELDSFSDNVFLQGIEKNEENSTADEDENVVKKAPKKIKRSHKQKMKGRATQEPLSNKQLKAKQTTDNTKLKSSTVGIKSSQGPGKKAIMQGLLVLRSASSSPITPNTGTKSEENQEFPPLVVGRSSKQNERVTFDLGRDHHLWFHVQGSPGSHCLLQLEPGQSASDSALQYAADVASYFSQARGSTQVPVGYCSPKYIKRISGGSPGSVSILKQEGVVYGRPDIGKCLIDKYSSGTM